MLLTYIRTTLLYVVLIIVIRMMGKRQIGQMEASEFVVTMLVANLASIPMQDGDIPLYTGVVPILTVLGLELLLSSLNLRFVKFRKLLCGKPVILIDHGKILRENLLKTRVTLDELTELLRGKDVLSPDIVQYAILETNGNLSVFLYPQHQPVTVAQAEISPEEQYIPYTLIADGYLYRENLRLSGRNEKWLEKELKKHHATLAATFLMPVDRGGKVLWLPKEEA